MKKANEIRVLHYVPAFNKGGIESLVLNLAENMPQNVKFSIMAEREIPKEAKEIIENMNGKIYQIPKLKIGTIVKHIKTIKKIIKEEKFDVVHCHSASSRPFVMIFSKMYKISKRIYHSHSVNYENKKLTFIKNIIRKISIKCANILIACSENASEIFKNRKYEILYNGIDTPNFEFKEEIRERIRSQLKIQKNFVIGHIGRFSPLKNHVFMIEIIKEILNTKPNAKLLLAGDGPERENIEKYAKQLGVRDNVIFLGNISNSNEMLQAMDIFIFPSLSEAMPLTPIEAQASGLPVIVSEAVTANLKCTEYFKKILLSEGVKKWCQEILKVDMVNNREEQYKIVMEKEFDIKKMTKKLYEIYVIK